MSQLTFAAAREIYRASLAAYEAADFTSMGLDAEEAHTNAHFSTQDDLLQAPVATAFDLLEKMRILDERYTEYQEAIPKVDWEALRRDVESLTKPPADADSPTWQAWLRYADEAWSIRGDRPGTETSRADERTLADYTAATPLGVAGKLRYALHVHADSPWLEAAALGADVPNIAEKMDMEDAVNQTIWSSIQSLEAMEARP
ncbi:hypothetical protein [Sphingobium sp. WCS2017Hpa-17]|uniref:hypothetical protein n=1 Tax=Sphingobium sp. WCS2017Hpa-17 TaxID=3073638 RepID=UPI00288AF529|nr:hypothetical protein [Sphingobium sp. WCS2017Hpa-17]